MGYPPERSVDRSLNSNGLAGVQKRTSQPSSADNTQDRLRQIRSNNDSDRPPSGLRKQVEHGEHESSIRKDIVHDLSIPEICDNLGCNGPHNHDDCPVPRRCWGCRSSNHFWSQCPMTCKECGSRRHVPEYCNSFEAPDSHGKAYPRGLQVRGNKQNSSFSPSTSKASPCDNRECPGLHRLWQCPMPSFCSGCHKNGHFWISCQERCTKCKLAFHNARYCQDFEPWKLDKSKPKQSIQGFGNHGVKRRQECDLKSDQENALQERTSKRHREASPSSDHKQRSSGRALMKVSRGPANGKEDNTPQIPPRSSGRGSQQIDHGSLVPPVNQKVDYNGVVLEDTRQRDQVYCTFWLRHGHCNYQNTPLGCKYAHQVPDKQMLQAMGIEVLPTQVREEQLRQMRSRRSSPIRGRVKTEESCTNGDLGSREVTAWLDHNIPSIQACVSFLDNQTEYYNSHSRHQESSQETPSSASVSKFPLPQRTPYKNACTQTDVTDEPPAKTEKEKAFEEEEFFKQKRHEAEMRRKADQQKLEYEHQLRLAELRRR